ncbi:MAG: hypothetical protein IJ738_04775 [Alphaproteobacteria bacterium]|nr:hypothetical protein [Alphaproteobacteria bacterium]
MKTKNETPMFACMFLGIIAFCAVWFFGGCVYDESIMLSLRGVLAIGLVGVSILYGMELGHRIADIVYAVCMAPLVLYPLYRGDIKLFILNVIGIFALMVGFYIFFRCNPVCKVTMEKWVFQVISEEK